MATPRKATAKKVAPKKKVATPRKRTTTTAKAKATAKSPTSTRSPQSYRGPRQSYRGPREPSITSDVTAAVVEEIPPRGRGSNRSSRYADVLAQVREKVGPGRPVAIATFVGKDGAGVARRDLERGNRLIDGDPSEWQFDSRRAADGGSILYATLLEDAQE